MRTSGTITVAIVEDHEMVAESLATAIDAEADLEVVVIATRAGAVLEEVVPRNPDVVLMDLMLPDGDGLQAAGALLERCPDCRVVILTAATGGDLVDRAVEAGCAGLLSKTQPIAEVRSAIRKVAAGEAAFSPNDLLGLLDRRRDPPAPSSVLTEREQTVLQLVADGVSTEAIADRLVLSQHTVRNHVRNILAKLGAHSRIEAVAIARREGLLSLPDGPGGR